MLHFQQSHTKHFTGTAITLSPGARL